MKKLDINLLPKKRKISRRLIVGIIAGLIGVALIITAGINIPKSLLAKQRNDLADIKDELGKYANVQSDYVQKLAEFAQLQELQKNLNDFSSTEHQTLELIKAINDVKPEAIVLTYHSYGVESIVLNGFSTGGDDDIAAFEVALRTLELFDNIIIGTINGTDNVRNFDITLIYPVVPLVTPTEEVSSNG